MGKTNECPHARAMFEFRGSVFRKGFYQDGLSTPDFGYIDTVIRATCHRCNAKLSLGPSNDDSEAVRVEMRAAELVAMRALEPGRFTRESSADEALGFEAASERCAPRLGEESGWLTFEMESHDDRDQRDADAWPWDPTRPIAGQYEVWARAAEVEASTPSRHLDGWTMHAPGMDDESGPMTASCHSPEMDDDSEFDDDAPVLDDTPLTVSIDSDGVPAVQLNGLDTAPPLLTPDEAEELADDLLLGADAARQAGKDGYHGPAVVVELLIAADHESQRAAEPDCRDEDGPEVEVPGNTNAALASIGPLMTAAEANELHLGLRREDDDACGTDSTVGCIEEVDHG